MVDVNLLTIVNEGEALGVVGGDAASITVGTTSEQIDDRVAALLAAGTNITLTYDDVAGTLTIAAAGGGGGASIAVEDEGAEILASASRFDFTGAGVTVSDGGAGQANVVIPGAATAPAWTTYTPTWTASTSNPSVGNGTIWGRYKQIATDALAIEAGVKFGSTTTVGSGDYRMSLPAGFTLDGYQTALIAHPVGNLWTFDVGLNSGHGIVFVDPNLTGVIRGYYGNPTSSALFGSSSESWGSGDAFTMNAFVAVVPA